MPDKEQPPCVSPAWARQFFLSALTRVVVIGLLLLTGMAQYRILTRLTTVELQLAKLQHLSATPKATAPERGRNPLPDEPLSLDLAPTKGQRTARVALIEFADFECSFCGSFALETLPDLEQRYIGGGKVLFVFRHLPLSRTQGDAVRAAEAAECAGLQNRFWEMHDLLFRRQGQFSAAELRKHASAIGLKVSDFNSCLNGDTSAKVKSDAELARRIGIFATPTFAVGVIDAIGRVKVVDVLVGGSLVELSAALDKALRTASSS